MRIVPRLLSPFTHPTLPSSPRDHLQWPLVKTSLPPMACQLLAGPFPGDSPSSWLLWCSTHAGIPPTLLLHLLIPLPLLGFPDGPNSKEPVCQCRRQGRSLGEGNGNPLQYSCLENPMGRRAWRATVHRVAKSRTRLKRLSTPSPGSGGPTSSEFCSVHHPLSTLSWTSELFRGSLFSCMWQFPTTSLVMIKPIFPVACSIFPFISSTLYIQGGTQHLSYRNRLLSPDLSVVTLLISIKVILLLLLYLKVSKSWNSSRCPSYTLLPLYPYAKMLQ